LNIFGAPALPIEILRLQYALRRLYGRGNPKFVSGTQRTMKRCCWTGIVPHAEWSSRDYPHGTHMKLFSCLWTVRWKSPQLPCDQMKKVGLADWRTSNGLPSASDPETEADRTPRGSLLACMTAQWWATSIKALKRQGGDGLAASRRFFRSADRFGNPQNPV